VKGSRSRQVCGTAEAFRGEGGSKGVGAEDLAIPGLRVVDREKRVSNVSILQLFDLC
jgi:hypothetical protein